MEYKEYDISNGKKITAYYRVNEATEVSKEAFEKIIIPALEKQEKYRWHDLKKDPNDVPDTYREVITCYYNKSLKYKAYESNFYLEHHNSWEKNEEYNMKVWQVIAWKEIEPFEESGDEIK